MFKIGYLQYNECILLFDIDAYVFLCVSLNVQLSVTGGSLFFTQQLQRARGGGRSLFR